MIDSGHLGLVRGGAWLRLSLMVISKITKLQRRCRYGFLRASAHTGSADPDRSTRTIQRVGINYTYIGEFEKGSVEPPSKAAPSNISKDLKFAP